jgi:hypothetical protein
MFCVGLLRLFSLLPSLSLLQVRLATPLQRQAGDNMADPDDVSHGLLLRLFQSDFFSPHLALS